MSKKTRKIIQQRGEKVQCSECGKFQPDKSMITTTTGFNCDRCYEPDSPAGNSGEGSISPEYFGSQTMGDNFNNYSPVVLSTNLDIKVAETKIVKDIDAFLKSIEHNFKIAIPDAPFPKPPNLFRDYFDRWMKLLTFQADHKCIITDRGTGKSKNAGLYLLSRIAVESDYYATFVMRNFDDNTKIIRPQYEGYIDDFVR